MLSCLISLRKPPFKFGKNGQALWYSQTLDHFNSSNNERFNQRYYVNDTFFNESISPPRLIVYIGGEAELTERYTQRGSYIDLANATQSLVVSLEHRYFGESQPFEYLTTKNLRYLTSEQALADLAEFITYFKENQYFKAEPTVLVVGGSYPGTLASYFRLKYPHLSNFSWSSSAPLWAKNNFTEYDEHCAMVLKERCEICYKKTKEIYDYFNKYPEDLNDPYIKFKLSTDDDAHLSIISDFIAGIVQYDNSYNLVAPYCSEIKHADGIEASKVVFKKYFEMYLEKSGIKDPDKLDDFLNINESSKADNADSRAWTWMTCNEFGWYQTASGLLRPARVNLSYSERVCQLYFGISMANNLEEKNLLYGGIYPKSSMIYFTNGNTDPWSRLSVYDNVTDPSVGRFSTHIVGASHCSDLHSYSDNDSPDLKLKREEILFVMEDWIKGERKTNCMHGDYIMGMCVCEKGYFGKYCDIKHVSHSLFHVFTTLVVVLPTMMMVIIGCSAWHLFRKNHDDTDIRTIPSILN
jgi:serine protease 16